MLADEQYLFIENILGVLRSSKICSQELNHLTNELKSEFETFKLVRKKGEASAMTDIVRAKDSLRDSCYLALRHYIVACNKRDKPEWENATNALIVILKSYGWSLHNFSDSKQSSKLSSLIQEINNSTVLKGHISTISADAWLKELSNAQAQYDSALKQRMSENIGIPEIETNKVFKNIRTIIGKIFKYIDIMYGINRDSNYKDTIADLNSVIAPVAQNIKARESSRRKE